MDTKFTVDLYFEYKLFSKFTFLYQPQICTRYSHQHILEIWNCMSSSQFVKGIYIIYHLSGGHVTDTDTSKWYLMSFPFFKNPESAPS